MPADPRLTVASAAARPATAEDHVRALIHAGRLRAANVGPGRKPRWRIDPADPDAFPTARPVKTKGRPGGRKRPAGATEYFCPPAPAAPGPAAVPAATGPGDRDAAGGPRPAGAGGGGLETPTPRADQTRGAE